MILRKVNDPCPNCKRVGLEAIEITENIVAGYRCVNCGAEYDAELFHDWEHKKHYWLGKLRNPEFWELKNRTIIEGLEEMRKREKNGIKEYSGKYLIEEIKQV